MSDCVVLAEKVRLVFPNGKGLHGISFEVRRGERVVLAGPSGAGKSTLLRCLNGLLRPQEGTLRVLGEEVARLSEAGLRRLRRRVGMVFQNYNLVPRYSALANTLTGALGRVPWPLTVLGYYPPTERRRAREKLREVGLEEFQDQPAARLSGGQKQRVGIARALMQEPELLLADEPVSNLDPVTAHRVLDLLSEIVAAHGLTLILSLHDVKLALRYGDRILGIRDGRVVLDARTTQLSEDALREIYR